MLIAVNKNEIYFQSQNVQNVIEEKDIMVWKREKEWEMRETQYVLHSSQNFYQINSLLKTDKATVCQYVHFFFLNLSIG